jgi:hypothetical protein
MTKAKQILNFIINEKAKGNSFQEMNIQMRIMMKGLNVKGILDGTVADTPALFAQLDEIAKEYKVDLTNLKTT